MMKLTVSMCEPTEIVEDHLHLQALIIISAHQYT